MRVGVRRARAALGAVGTCAALALVATGCFPQSKGASSEIAEAAAGEGSPPVFPETGRVPDELLVEGLVWDFTDAPSDLNLWVPSAEEARCAAEKIVANLGVRISDLGYLPDSPGASLNDIALNEFERQTLADLFSSCVDAVNATASLLLGRGNMDPEDAECMADGLAESGFLSEIVSAWAFGRQADPFEDESALADALVAYANVCLPDTAFFWLGVDLPGDDEVTGVDEGSGGEADEGLPDSAGSSTTTSAPAFSGNTGGS